MVKVALRQRYFISKWLKENDNEINNQENKRIGKNILIKSKIKETSQQ